MENNSQPIRRRKFLKAGIGVGFLAVIPFKKLLSSSSFSQGQQHDRDTLRPEQFVQKIQDIAQKYGGEFGGIQPEPRRNDHGCI
jgi:hypothetical protein